MNVDVDIRGFSNSAIIHLLNSAARKGFKSFRKFNNNNMIRFSTEPFIEKDCLLSNGISAKDFESRNYSCGEEKMIAVNVKSYEELLAVVKSVKNSGMSEPAESTYKMKGPKTIVFVSDSSNSWSLADTDWFARQEEYKYERVLTFEEFKSNYLDVKTANGTVLNDTDPVNHPKHYNSYSFEVIDVIDEVVPNFPSSIAGNIQNVIKYVFRAPFKNTMKEDLEKAAWYLDHAIKILDKE